MNKIYCIMGKSSSGKDTLYKELTAQVPGLKTVTPYTTRPIREGESNGVEYHFVTEEENLLSSGRIIRCAATGTMQRWTTGR